MMSGIKCSDCGHVQRLHWDLLTCERCGFELGEVGHGDEPVRRLVIDNARNSITDPKLMSPAAQQAIAFRNSIMGRE